MRFWRTLVFLIFGLCVIVGIVAKVAKGANSLRTGDWTVSKSDEAGKVEFSLIEHHRGGNSSHESDWPMSAFQGVDFAKSGRQDVHFTIVRDAGKIDCEGYLKDGEGAGVFHFEPNPDYVRQMQSIGFPVDDEKQYAMAVQDVSLEFARQMKSEHLSGLDTDKLIAFRIFKVDHEFIADLRAAGLSATDSDKLVAFRIHGVTPQMVRTIRQAGYSPDEDTLIAMRIHGATPEWIEGLKKEGYDHVELDKLIAFRIHGVSPEFIGKVQGLGYPHPEPDQLISMRIFNVTPEYIAQMRSRGMQHLTIDELVNMRIHGID
jgi:hypothetical protein